METAVRPARNIILKLANASRLKKINALRVINFPPVALLFLFRLQTPAPGYQVFRPLACAIKAALILAFSVKRALAAVTKTLTTKLWVIAII